MKKAFLYILAILGYMATASAQVSIVDITTTNVTCNGGTDGSVTITVTGGQAPYIYTSRRAETFTIHHRCRYLLYLFQCQGHDLDRPG